jgi:hypothetical protein
MTTNYRPEIVKILDRYAVPGTDWERALLAGASGEIDAATALEIATWLEDEAPVDWRAEDEALYDRIAADIRAAVAADREPGR